MLHTQGKDIGFIHFIDNGGIRREIAYVYHQGRMLWQLIVGYLFTKDGFALKTKDDFILKAKDQ